MRLFIGLDVGGTSVKHGVVTAEGEIREQGEHTTAPGGGHALLNQLSEIITVYADRHELSGAGVGTAGAVDFARGRIVGHSPNIPDWSGTPVAAELTRRTAMTVRVDNDANCMALAEARIGAGRGCSSVLFLTLGTGIGSALLLNNRLWRGAHHMGGEWGHATIVEDGRECPCGKRGHLEAYASARALVKRTLQLARRGVSSQFAEISDAAPGGMGSREIFDAAAEGDAAAVQAIRETASHLATGIASALNLLDCERVVVGGGMAAAGDSFLVTVTNLVRERVHAGLAEFVRIVPAELGNRAGLIGAALLAADADE
jgi:glucokinase